MLEGLPCADVEDLPHDRLGSLVEDLPDLGSLVEGLPEGRNAARRFAGSDSAWKGMRRTDALMLYVNACRDKKLEIRRGEGVQAAQDPIADFVDGQMLRSGDQLKRPATENPDIYNNNQYTVGGIIRSAFDYIGARARPDAGVRGTKRFLAIAVSVAFASFKLMQKRLSEFVFHNSESNELESAVVVKGYDLTPWKIRFGRLAAKLAPTARYFVPSDEPNKWDCVGLDQFRQRRGTSATWTPQYGTVEVMGQTQSVHFLHKPPAPDDVKVESNFFLSLPPQFCVHGNSSTVQQGLNQAAGILSVENVKKLAETVSHVWWIEAPDSHKVNRRIRRYISTELGPVSNAYLIGLDCACHSIHRVVATGSQEVSFIGDVHAVMFTESLPANREKMLRVFKDWLQRTAVRQPNLCPDEAVWKHNHVVYDHVRNPFNRSARSAKQHLSGGGTDPARERFSVFWGGVDPRLGFVVHPCMGCCVSTSNMVDNLFTSAIEFGIMMPTIAKEPSISRWGTCSTCLAAELPQMYFNSIGQIVTTGAFATYDDVPAAVGGETEPVLEDSEVWRRRIKSKAYRCKKVLDSDKACSMCFTAVVVDPINIALRTIEQLNASNDSLAEMVHPVRYSLW